MGRSAGTASPTVYCDGGNTTPAQPLHVDSNAKLNETIADHEIVLVEFHADWCGPCELLAPIIETIAEDTGAVVVKIDVEEHREIAFAHRARSVPMMELYTDGTRVERLVGGLSEEELRSLIDDHRPGD